jgi:hypothetical protein
MIEALHRYVVPVLEARNFSGRFPDFRRISPNAVHLLSIHFARHMPAYAVEVSCAPLTGLAVVGKLVPAEELTAWHASAAARFRIGPDDPDQWFPFKEPLFSIGDSYKRAALAVVPYIESQAELWWKEASSLTRSGRE